MAFVCMQNSVCAARCAKGLWPQPRSVLVLPLPHQQQWEVGLAMGQDGAASIKSQVHPDFEADVSLMQAYFRSTAQYRLWCEVWATHDVHELSSPPAPGIPPPCRTLPPLCLCHGLVCLPHSLATIYAMVIALEGSGILFGAHPL